MKHITDNEGNKLIIPSRIQVQQKLLQTICNICTVGNPSYLTTFEAENNNHTALSVFTI